MANVERPYRLAVRAVIRDGEGRQLLLRRSSECRLFVGAWEWPGGKVEAGEDVDTAVRREVREETGLDVALTGVAGAYEVVLPERRVAILCFEGTAAAAAGEVRLSHEHDRFAWVTAAEVAAYELVPGMAEVAARLRRR
jgi:8-oxo-dGTP diphosphatase